DYRLVTTGEGAEKAARIIRKYAAEGALISTDIESDDFSEAQDGSDVQAFACGFSPKKGFSLVCVWKHRDIKSKINSAAVYEVVKSLLTDETVKKTYHYGCSDVSTLKDKNGIEAVGYE